MPFLFFFLMNYNGLGSQWLCVLFPTVNTTVKSMGADSLFSRGMRKKQKHG